MKSNKRIVRYGLVMIAIIMTGAVMGVVAIPNKKQIVNKHFNTQEWALLIDFEGGFLGYQLTVKNVGNETVNGSLSINITTDAWIMLLGRNLEFPLCPFQLDLSPGEKESYNPGPIIGFGPSTINMEVEFIDSQSNMYNATSEGSGFVFLFFTTCDATPINIP